MDVAHTVIVLVLYVLASARITRLINGDKITDPLRMAFASRARDWDRTSTERARWAYVLYYLECPWCAGFWVCLAAAYPVTRLLDWPWWCIFPLALAANHLVGVFAFAADTEEIEVEEDAD